MQEIILTFTVILQNNILAMYKVKHYRTHTDSKLKNSKSHIAT